MTATLEAMKARRLANRELSGIADNPRPPNKEDNPLYWLLGLIVIIIILSI